MTPWGLIVWMSAFAAGLVVNGLAFSLALSMVRAVAPKPKGDTSVRVL